MSHRLALTLVFLSVLFLSSGLGAQQAVAEDIGSQQVEVKAHFAAWETSAEEKKPTGACYINAGGIENCTSAMTRDACYKAASRVGGVADWREGERCKQ